MSEPRRPRGRWKTAAAATPEWLRFQAILQEEGITMRRVERKSGLRRTRLWYILHRAGGYLCTPETRSAVAEAVGRPLSDIWTEDDIAAIEQARQPAAPAA